MTNWTCDLQQQNYKQSSQEDTGLKFVYHTQKVSIVNIHSRGNRNRKNNIKFKQPKNNNNKYFIIACGRALMCIRLRFFTW